MLRGRRMLVEGRVWSPGGGGLPRGGCRSWLRGGCRDEWEGGRLDSSLINIFYLSTVHYSHNTPLSIRYPQTFQIQKTCLRVLPKRTRYRYFIRRYSPRQRRQQSQRAATPRTSEIICSSLNTKSALFERRTAKLEHREAQRAADFSRAVERSR